jgi:hypothetical protein
MHQLGNGFDHYFELKNALVTTDGANAAKHANDVETVLSKVHCDEQTGPNRIRFDESYEIPPKKRHKVIAYKT